MRSHPRTYFPDIPEVQRRQGYVDMPRRYPRAVPILYHCRGYRLCGMGHLRPNLEVRLAWLDNSFIIVSDNTYDSILYSSGLALPRSLAVVCRRDRGTDTDRRQARRKHKTPSGRFRKQGPAMITIGGYDISGLFWFFAAGTSIFPGCTLIITAILLSNLKNKRWLRCLMFFSLIIGICLVYFSATPFHLGFHVLWIICFAWWSSFVILSKKNNSLFFKYSKIILFSITTIAVCLEIPFRIKPNIPLVNAEELYVIGDSISAGIGTAEELTWPKIIRNKKQLTVTDLSIAGATVNSATKRQLPFVKAENSIVILEIGGNDLFGPTPYDEFERALKNILEVVTSQKRAVIMLELPLLPWQIKYGRIQRKLANQYNVVLIPKKVLAGVFSAKNATVDLAHLSPTGQKLMSEQIWNIIKGSVASPNPTEQTQTLR